MSDVAISPDSSPDKSTVNRWALATLTSIAGVMVGIMPVIVLTRGAYLLPFFFFAMVAIAAAYFFFNKAARKKLQAPETYPLNFLELLSAALSAVSAWALSGFIWYICYRVAIFIGWLVALIGVFGAFNYEAIAFWVTLSIACLLGIGVFIASLSEMISKLYPNTTSFHSIFYELATRRRRWLITCLLIGVAVPALVGLIGYFLIGSLGTWFYLFLQLYLFIATSGLSAVARPGHSAKQPSASAVEAVIKLLNNVGYKVIQQPKIGDKELDPFLINLDLLAYNDERALAVEIKTQKESPEPVEWAAASSLRMTGLALIPELENFGIKAEDIELFLILNDVEPAPSLINFCDNLTSHDVIHTVKLPSTMIEEILASDDQTALQNIARDIGFSMSSVEAAAPSILPLRAAEGGELL